MGDRSNSDADGAMRIGLNQGLKERDDGKGGFRERRRREVSIEETMGKEISYGETKCNL